METPKTLQAAIQHFSDYENCRKFMVAVRWLEEIVRCPRYLLRGTVTSDQVSGVDMRLDDTSHGKVAGADLHQEGGKIIGKCIDTGPILVVLDRQGHIERAGPSQCDDLFVRKACVIVKLRGALLHSLWV